MNRKPNKNLLHCRLSEVSLDSWKKILKHCCLDRKTFENRANITPTCVPYRKGTPSTAPKSHPNTQSVPQTIHPPTTPSPSKCGRSHRVLRTHSNNSPLYGGPPRWYKTVPPSPPRPALQSGIPCRWTAVSAQSPQCGSPISAPFAGPLRVRRPAWTGDAWACTLRRRCRCRFHCWLVGGLPPSSGDRHRGTTPGRLRGSPRDCERAGRRNCGTDSQSSGDALVSGAARVGLIFLPGYC